MIRASRWRVPSGAFLGIGLVLAATGISVAVVTGRVLFLIGAIGALAALLVGIRDWRWSIYGLLLFLPFSGIPIIASYPHTQVAVLLKDILFVVPAYVGFGLALKGKSIRLPGAPLVITAALVLLIAVQSLPKISDPLVPLVGAKVYLLYIPCLALGYHFVKDRDDLTHLLRTLTVVGMAPLIIGIAEAVLLDTGHSDVVYQLYGPAAQAVSQNFFDAGVGNGAVLLLVPSTFSFVSQYYDFTVFMVVITFAYWRLSRNNVAAVLWAVAIIASFTSGARSAFVLTPFVLAVMALLTWRARQMAATTLAILAGLLSSAGVLALGLMDTLLFSAGLGSNEFQAGFVNGVPTALGITLTGLGTGHATAATRYVLGSSDVFLSYAPFSESWWVKVILELGVPGLLLFGLLFGWLIARAYRAHRTIGDPGLAATSAALLAFTAWVILYLTKGPQIDLDPVNVYFWLFGGILLGIPSLAKQGIRAPSGVGEASLAPRSETVHASG
jgi:hypothetical protein